jgi:hypothetical protein
VTLKIHIDEAKAKEIHLSLDLSEYSHAELSAADAWLKEYAIAKLAQYLRTVKTSRSLKDYIMLMVRTNYGSVETDEFLAEHGCYPEWVEYSKL